MGSEAEVNKEREGNDTYDDEDHQQGQKEREGDDEIQEQSHGNLP